ncbi:MAG TPA: hypothetical protein RMH99_21745 [Sandaracinaceae bacterium LLY-WYZ-13_1]|nr:hypothetical protein [Sandaracinaceae bacterium LLY-WYZ-13_1]
MELATTVTQDAGMSSELVLVVGDDPLVSEAVCLRLGKRGCHALHTDDFELALSVARARRPAVLVLDQILESEASTRLLRRLEDLGDDAPWVVLVRYAPGPTGPFRSLHVTQVAGPDWFEELPDVVARQVYARAW